MAISCRVTFNGSTHMFDIVQETNDYNGRDVILILKHEHYHCIW